MRITKFTEKKRKKYICFMTQQKFKYLSLLCQFQPLSRFAIQTHALIMECAKRMARKDSIVSAPTPDTKDNTVIVSAAMK